MQEVEALDFSPQTHRSPLEKAKRTVCPGMKTVSKMSRRRQQNSMSSWIVKGIAPATTTAATTSASRLPLTTQETTSEVREAIPGEETVRLGDSPVSRKYQTIKNDLRSEKVRADGLMTLLTDAANACGPEAKMTSPGGH